MDIDESWENTGMLSGSRQTRRPSSLLPGGRQQGFAPRWKPIWRWALRSGSPAPSAQKRPSLYFWWTGGPDSVVSGFLICVWAWHWWQQPRLEAFKGRGGCRKRRWEYHLSSSSCQIESSLTLVFFSYSTSILYQNHVASACEIRPEFNRFPLPPFLSLMS